MFSVFLLPTIVILYLISHSGRTGLAPFFFGIGCGTLCVVFAILFGSDFRLYPASLFKNFSLNLLQEALLPALVLTVLFFILSRDDVQFKMDKLVLVLSGFFCLYIPFRIFFRSETLSVFALFFKPVLLACFVFGFSFAVKLFIKNLISEKKPLLFFISCFCGLGCASVPALAEIWWYGGGAPAVWLLLVVVQVVFTLILGVLNHVDIGSLIPQKKQTI